MSPGHSLLTPGSLGSPTPTTNGTKKFSWERPKLNRNTFSSQSGLSNGHRVTFSGSSKGSHKASSSDNERERNYSSQSDTERPPDAPPPTPAPPRANEPWVSGEDAARTWQKIDRQNSVSRRCVDRILRHVQFR